MRLKLWPADTIARRFTITIVLAILVAVVLAKIVLEFAGVWGRPPLRETGLLERADDIVRMIDVASTGERQSLAAAVSNATFRVDWHSNTSAVAATLEAAAKFKSRQNLQGFKFGGRQHRMVVFDHDDTTPSTAGAYFDQAVRAGAFFLSVDLADRSWVVFTVPSRLSGMTKPDRVVIGLALLIVSIGAVSAAATYQLSRPIRQFTAALRRFGTNPRASPVPETGPSELRASIRAFNAMQSQIQKFVQERTAMLAAISHDLRTPLTKMRLRGELVEDEEQRARLFRDVDDMQAMVHSALAFFRDDFQGEETTTFDFPEMLRTIADDYNDHGCEVTYNGADHVAFRGRPFALKRAFTNLVDNAVKYGRAPELEFRCSEERIVVVVRDSGPGIPPEAAEHVFAPFYRLERSRNRATGGVGLGLTSARAVLRGHGGDISLRNRPNGGLEVEVTLPVAS